MKTFVLGRAAAAFCLTLCLLASQAMPVGAAGERGRPLGEMMSFGKVMVNGEEAASGATVFPGSKFTTAGKSGAVVSLGELGRVRLSSMTATLINFGDEKVEGTLEAGVITVSKPEGVSAVFSTRDGQVVAGKESAAVFTLNVRGGDTVVKAESGSVELRAGETTKLIAAGQTGGAGTPNPGGQGGDDDDDEPDTDGLFWLGVVGFTGAVVGAIIWAVTRDDEGAPLPGPPNVIVPSPSR